MIKIFFLIESLSGGGAEKVLSTLVKNIDRSKFDVTVCSIVDTGQYVDEVKQYSRYYSILPNPARCNSHIARLYYAFFYKLVYRWIPKSLLYRLFVPKGQNVEIAFIEGLATQILSYSSNIKSKTIAWTHIDLAKHHEISKLYHSLEEESKSYLRFNHLIGVSNTVSKSLANLYQHPRINTVYNPIDSTEIRNKAKEKLPGVEQNSKHLRLVTIGRLVPQKAYDRLLRITQRLLSEGFQYELWILGEGEQRRQLEHFINEHHIEKQVKLLGFQANPYAYLNCCNLFICPSIAEGYSTAVTEALILGLPIITTNCSGMDELLKDGEIGLITENSEEALYRGLRHLLENPDKIAYYKEQAQKRSDDFKIETLMKTIENLFIS